MGKNDGNLNHGLGTTPGNKRIASTIFRKSHSQGHSAKTRKDSQHRKENDADF